MIKNASINVASTGITVAGGTAETVKSLGDNLGQHDTYMGTGNILTRTSMTFKAKPPVISVGAPNGYTQARSSVILRMPKVLANENHTVNTVRIELSTDLETSSVEIRELLRIAGQTLNDSDFDEYWVSQNLS